MITPKSQFLNQDIIGSQMVPKEFPESISSFRCLNLLVYSDSLAFPRRDGSQDIGATYPFILKDLIERNTGIRTNVVYRGQGAAVAQTLKSALLRDLGYFGGTNDAINVAVFQFGIVDSAPRPITFAVLPTIKRLPIVGSSLAVIVKKYRRGLQNLWSYTLTPKRKFRREYAEILKACGSASIKPVAIGLPLPPVQMERRSPGFRRNVALYNEIIRESNPEYFCDVEEGMSDEQRLNYLMSDGHHLTPAGHLYYARVIMEKIKKILQR